MSYPGGAERPRGPCLRALLAVVALLGPLGGCIDSGFLRGVACSEDRDCGRSLSCEQQVCGGCPADVPVIDGRCACPGDRVLECRALVAPQRCMPVCRSATELCEVVEVSSDGVSRTVPPCDGTNDEHCFGVMLDASECEDGEAAIQVQPDDSAMTLVVNCPPPESDESPFDCEPP